MFSRIENAGLFFNKLLIVTENSNYAISAANPWVADRLAGVDRPQGGSLWPLNDPLITLHLASA
jgi:hypothetical protein